MEVEVVLNSWSELLEYMVNEGIIGIIGEMIVSETDPIILVCFLIIFFYIVSAFFFRTYLCLH